MTFVFTEVCTTEEAPKQVVHAVRRAHLTPAQAMVLSFAGMILAGAGLLCLPFASVEGVEVGFLDALFTAVSANCVTGLVTYNTAATWTAFGKAVILVLIQLGGLGFFTVLSLALAVFRRRISLRNRLAVQATFNQDNMGDMGRLVKRVVKITLVAEATGAVLLALAFYVQPPPGAHASLGNALVNGVFHAVSAFCNAGFDILGPDSLVPYAANPAVNAIIMALIVSGGLGFVVWTDMADGLHASRKKSFRGWLAHLSVHSKMALVVTAFLILFGAAAFLAAEYNNPGTLGAMPLWEKVQAAFFQSVTLRTAGFNSIPQGNLTDASKFLSSLLMMIGGSPAGTAGGFKTVTLGVIAFTVFSLVRGRHDIEAFGRRLPLELLQKALTVFCLLIGIVLLSTFILCFTEANAGYPHTFMDLLFETASGAGTVGVSTGITPHLTSAGKVVLILCMFLGRLGPTTVAIALTYRHQGAGMGAASFPKEKVIIG